MKDIFSDYGTGRISEIFAHNINDIVVSDSEVREKRTREYGGMVLNPLMDAGIPIETLEHLKVEFVNPAQRESKDKLSLAGANTDLGKIQREILKEFGKEVFVRLNLSVVEKKIWNFRGKK